MDLVPVSEHDRIIGIARDELESFQKLSVHDKIVEGEKAVIQRAQYREALEIGSDLLLEEFEVNASLRSDLKLYQDENVTALSEYKALQAARNRTSSKKREKLKALLEEKLGKQSRSIEK